VRLTVESSQTCERPSDIHAKYFSFQNTGSLLPGSLKLIFSGFAVRPLAMDESRLPFRNAPNRASDRREPPVNSQLFQVLLVDDNPGDVFIITEILGQCGLHFEITVIAHGENAISFLQSLEANPNAQCPALVLLDLNLPGISGAEVLTHIRRHMRCCQVPVVIITSSDSPSDRRTVQQLGANVYFRKPTDLLAYRELGNIVRQVLDTPPQSVGSA
jgi:chemotaxis family two-component system response regulator Rcp1